MKPIVLAAIIGLTWDSDPGAHITSYRLYRGIESGKYDRSADVGPTNLVFAQAIDGQSNYFAVRAVNAAGESPPSNEVVFFSEASAASNATASILFRAAIALEEGSPTVLLTAPQLPRNGKIQWTGSSLMFLPQSNFVGADALRLNLHLGAGPALGAGLDLLVTQASPRLPPLAVLDRTMIVRQSVGYNGTVLTSSPTSSVPTTFIISVPPSNGVTSGKPPQVLYRPNSTNFRGTDTFWYYAVRAGKTSAPAAVRITVTP